MGIGEHCGHSRMLTFFSIAVNSQMSADCSESLPRQHPGTYASRGGYERLRFAFRVRDEWQWIPAQFDAGILSDEAGPPGVPNFTGGICRNVLSGPCR